MIGYVPGDSALHRAHPFTPLALATAILIGVFALRQPAAISVAVLAALVMVGLSGSGRQVLRPALLIALPTWLLLLVIHAGFGSGPLHDLGPLRYSRPGLERALALGLRLTAILLAFLTALSVVAPSRLVEAMTDRGVPTITFRGLVPLPTRSHAFAPVYLLVSTLTLVPRMRQRIAAILEAQQCRGLRLGGSPLARVRAIGPLALPLILGALAEVDEQVLALDARGAAKGYPRTAIAPPPDSMPQRVLRALALLVAFGLHAARIAGVGL